LVIKKKLELSTTTFETMSNTFDNKKFGMEVDGVNGVLMEQIAANVKYSPPKKKARHRQMKLKHYLNREKKNWQKYPLRNCEFSDHLGKHVHQPPKYQKHIGELELSHAKCCDQCFLRPCVVEVSRLSMEQGLKAVWEYPPLAMTNVMKSTVDFMTKTCGVTFMKRMNLGRERVPRCVRSAVLGMMDLAVLEMNGSLRNVREHLEEDHIPDYLLEVNAEYHEHSMRLALEEMRGKLSSDEVSNLAEKYELLAKNNLEALITKKQIYVEGKVKEGKVIE